MLGAGDTRMACGPFSTLPERSGIENGALAAAGADVAPLRTVFSGCCKGGSCVARTTDLVAALNASPSAAAFFGLPAQVRREDGSRDALERVFQAITASCGRNVSWANFMESAVPAALLACVASRAAFAARAALASAVESSSRAPVAARAFGVASEKESSMMELPRPTLAAEQLAAAAASAAAAAAAAAKGSPSPVMTQVPGEPLAVGLSSSPRAEFPGGPFPPYNFSETLMRLSKALEENAAQRFSWARCLDGATRAAVRAAEEMCEHQQRLLTAPEEVLMTTCWSGSTPARDSDFGLSERQLGIAAKLHRSLEMSTCTPSIDQADNPMDVVWSPPRSVTDAAEVKSLTAEVSGLLAGFEELQKRAARTVKSDDMWSPRVAETRGRAYLKWALASQEHLRSLLMILEGGISLTSRGHLRSLLSILQAGGNAAALQIPGSLAAVDLSAGVRLSIHTALSEIGTRLRAALAALSWEGGAASPLSRNVAGHETSPVAWPATARHHAM